MTNLLTRSPAKLDSASPRLFLSMPARVPLAKETMSISHADNSPEVARSEVPAAVPMKRRILIAEDSESALKNLKELLETDSGLCLETVGNGSEALEALVERPHSIVVTDLKMPGLGGMELLEEVQKRRLPVSVIVTTGYGSIDEAVRAMRLGATDFLTKPINIEHLRSVIQRALRERALLDELAELKQQLHDRYSFHNILSKNSQMHEVFELIGHVAQTSSTVLIEGETGTGKEQVARAIHFASPRREGPMIAVNCAALPENLLESELFGHEKGSFTSAVSQRKGRFELADGGTLFLDEIGDVPAAMQAKLLRVLQERRFERVGGTEIVQADVRVIAATNRSLQRLVKQGKFREDLYYRLDVVKINLPLLHDRPEDIPLLATHFAQKYAPPGSAPKQISPEAMEVLLRHRWPGNVRELENAIERATVTSQDGFIRPENLPPDLTTVPNAKVPFSIDLSRPLTEQLAELTDAFEAAYIRRAMRKTRGHVGRTARISGLSRRTITDKVAQYKIDKSTFKTQCR
jgi:DNA-binding NtrC family response regulator